MGIRVTGGNQVGIFVTAVQPGSPAALQGLVPGDKILKVCSFDSFNGPVFDNVAPKVNDMEMSGVTREEAVLFLLSLQDQIELVVQHKRDEYDQVVASGHGDSFYVKTHFNYEQPAGGHMSFRKGEVFHVVDTLHKGVVGAWQAYRVGKGLFFSLGQIVRRLELTRLLGAGPNGQDLQQGVIPNSAAAEELATAQFNAAKKEAATSTSESRGSFFRRRRPTHRRSKSLGRVSISSGGGPVFLVVLTEALHLARTTGTTSCLPRRSASSRRTSASCCVTRASFGPSSCSGPSRTLPARNSSRTSRTSSPLRVSRVNKKID